MGFATAAIGGAVGFTAQCMSNSIQKIPLSRRKWMQNRWKHDVPIGDASYFVHVGSLSFWPLFSIIFFHYFFRSLDACLLRNGWSLGSKQMGDTRSKFAWRCEWTPCLQGSASYGRHPQLDSICPPIVRRQHKVNYMLFAHGHENGSNYQIIYIMEGMGDSWVELRVE